MESTLFKVLTAVGVFTIGRSVLSLVAFIRHHTRQGSLERYLHNNPWALVTGASDGVGFGFAEELASRGFNVIIHGRNEAKLEGKRKDLAARFPERQFDIAVADASNADPIKNAETVAAAAKDRNLTVLINNLAVAAVTQRTYKTLYDSTEEEVEAMVNLNIRFYTHLWRLISPTLRKNKPALVINIGSLGGVFFMPYLSFYSAAKAYQLAFSNSMTWEMNMVNDDIEVLGAQLAEVNSASNPREESWKIPSCRALAKAALAKVGCGRREVIPWWGHDLQTNVISLFSERLLKRFFKKAMGQMKAEEDKRLKMK